MKLIKVSTALEVTVFDRLHKQLVMMALQMRELMEVMDL